MKPIRMTVRALVAILICILLAPAYRGYAESVSTLQRDFSENLSMISVENTDGPIDVQTWDRREARVIASAGQIDSTRLSSRVLFERTAADTLKIRIKAGDPSIALTVYVPSSAHLSLRAGAGSVAINGAVAGLSVETESGAIKLNLPADSNSDLSLRTIDGSIESSIPATPFGKPDRHALDARIGLGGSTIIARSGRGNITLVRDAISHTVPSGRNFGSTGSIAPSIAPRAKALTAVSEVAPEPQPSAVGDGAAISGEMLKLEARLVSVNVKVTDANGKTLPALRKEDFVVYEDGVSQEVFHFEQVSAPLNIVLLLDLSGSTSHKMKIIKKAAQKFVDSLKPDDNIAVAAFTRRFFVISNFTTNHKLLNDRIDDIKNRHSGTAYYDAMWATMNLLDEAGGTRRAVVVMTDGVDNSLDHPDDSDYTPKHGFDELLARVEEADATIYPIYFDTEYETIGRQGRSGHDAYATARKQLEKLADETGAALFKAERAEDLEGVYKQVAAELHSLYSIAYTPRTLRKDGQWRKIGVAINFPGARVRTRRGYFAK